MSDNRRRFLAIHSALKKLYPKEPCGNLARHLNTLAMLISGIVGSKRVYLPHIAGKVPTFTKAESRVKRFSRFIDNERINFETLFSDQKSRGFYLHKSHISEPERLAQLMMAACLAYIWIIYLGNLSKRDGWDKIIHRTDRCDLSLFQMGLRLLDYFLNMEMEIPVTFNRVE